METIKTNDPRVALLNITRHNCNKMHEIAELMQDVCDAKRMCREKSLFTSARTPESLDKIMEELVYIFNCESNCSVMDARMVVDGSEVELPKYYDENCQTVKEN